MKIERVIAINFGALPLGDYEFGQANLIVGKNGAGKSTLQDLIQIVLAGNDHNLIKLNPAQDNDKRKNRHRATKRSLAGYAVNMTDDGAGRANGAICVIGLVFQPDPNEVAEPMTALWMAEVIPDPVVGQRRQAFRVRTEFGTLVRASLHAADLVLAEESDWRVLPPAEVHDSLFARHVRGHVTPALGKRDYVRQLHEWLSGGVMGTTREAERATRTFVQSIALTDIADIDSVVRDRVLDDMDMSLDVHETASTLRELEMLQHEAERLSFLEETLQVANDVGQDVLLRAAEGHQRFAAVAFGKHRRLTDQVQRAVIAQAGLEFERVDASQRAANLRIKVEEADRQYQQDMLRAGNQPALTERAGLMADQTAAVRSRDRVADKMASALETAWIAPLKAAMAELSVEEFPGIHVAWRSIGPHLDGVAEAVGALRPLMTRLGREPRDPEAIAALETQALYHDTHLELLSHKGPSGIQALREAAFEGGVTNSARWNEAKSRVEALEKQVKESQNGSAPVPPFISATVRELRRLLPMANPRLLCDLVRPRVGTIWQGAIEGLIGGARFTVVVDPRFEGEAHRMLRDLTREARAVGRGHAMEVTLAQSQRAKEDSQHRALPARSVVHELEFDDPLAKAFVTARYGSTLKVTDEAELDTIASGLMVDGRLSKGYGRRIAMMAANECFFGAEARRAQQLHLSHALREATAAFQQQETRRRAMGSLAGFAIDGASRPLTEDVQAWQRHDATARDAGQRLDALQALAPEAQDVLRQIEQRKAQLAELRVVLKRTDDEVQRLDVAGKGADKERERLEAQLGEATQELEGAWLRLESVRALIDPDSEPDSWRQDAEQLAAGPHFLDEPLGVVAGDIAQRFQTIQAHLDRYLDRAREGEGIERVVDVESSVVWQRFADIVRCIRSIEKRLVWLSDSSLRENAAKVRETKHKFASVLTDTLVQKMLSRTKEIHFVIEKLNRPLGNLDFGTHRKYRIVYAPKPEFDEYLKFFTAVRDKAQDLSPVDQWFGTEVFTPEEHAVREQIKHNLLHANSDNGRRELERIGNAANYFEYDLAFETELGTQVLYSEWGTGSGGESGTPPYILCGMLVANACGWFRGKGPRLRLLMLDEAFKVHDLERSNRVIEYLQRMGFQLIIAAQMEKATSILPNFTTTMAVSRLAATAGGRRTWVSQIHTLGLQRDPLRALWASRRREVAEQTEMDFRRDNPPPAPSSPPMEE